jgi:glycosyltransferase involved in cell wall biosynthesis
MKNLRIGVNALLLRSDPGYHKAGVSRYLHGVLEGLASRPLTHRFDVYVSAQFEVPAEWRDVPHFRFVVADLGRIGKKAPWNLFTCGRVANRERYDVWLSLFPETPFGLRVPLVTAIHDLVAFRCPESMMGSRARYFRFAISGAVRRSKALVCISEATRQDVLAQFRVPPERVLASPIGPGNLVEPVPRGANWPETRDRLGIPFERYVLSLCTLEPRKNLDRLVQAFARIAVEDGNRDLGMVVGGARGWKESSVFQTLESLGVEDRVHFLGYVDDADFPALFANCELFAYPSLFEGFGLPVLEAMLLGAPVLTSDVSSLPEVGGPCAIYCDPSDVCSIEGGLRRGLAPDFDREGAIACGFERARGFTWEAHADAILEAVERAAAESGR